MSGFGATLAATAWACRAHLCQCPALHSATSRKQSWRAHLGLPALVLLLEHSHLLCMRTRRGARSQSCACPLCLRLMADFAARYRHMYTGVACSAQLCHCLAVLFSRQQSWRAHLRPPLPVVHSLSLQCAAVSVTGRKQSWHAHHGLLELFFLLLHSHLLTRWLSRRRRASGGSPSCARPLCFQLVADFLARYCLTATCT